MYSTSVPNALSSYFLNLSVFLTHLFVLQQGCANKKTTTEKNFERLLIAWLKMVQDGAGVQHSVLQA